MAWKTKDAVQCRVVFQQCSIQRDAEIRFIQVKDDIAKFLFAFPEFIFRLF